MSTISEIELFFPEKVFTTEDFFRVFPEERESKTWPKLGIDQRHIIGDDEVPSDMGLKAAQQLFEKHPELKEQIDFLIFAGHERDHYTPVTASVLQAKLGLSTKIGCIDVH
ncbi:MAG: 3-oxoacyl-ACP synthase, partial [Bacteroidetes bacterium]